MRTKSGRDKAMLTVEKLRIWERFRGDSDIFGRVPKRHLEGISFVDWRQIESFVSDMRMMRNVTVADSFTEDFKRRMATLVANDEARGMLRGLAEEPWP